MGKIAEDEKVDFVILWVDGNDPEWQASKAKYTADKGQDASANRYRCLLYTSDAADEL